MKMRIWVVLALSAVLAIELVLVAANAGLRAAVARGAADGAKNGAATIANAFGDGSRRSNPHNEAEGPRGPSPKQP